MLSTSGVYGDKWRLEPEVKDTEFVFGNTRIVLQYDSTADLYFPQYTVRIYLKGRLVGELADIGFERVFANPENTYFLGVSNDGLTKQAYVIFNSDGKLLLTQPHDLSKVNYCKASVALIRQWYDEDNPSVEFKVGNGRLTDVIINHCSGTRYSLMQVSSKSPT